MGPRAPRLRPAWAVVEKFRPGLRAANAAARATPYLDRLLKTSPDLGAGWLMRLDQLQHEATSDCRVEGIAASLQHTHGNLRGKPVGGRHDTERA